jgi:site-specific DNA recombinase
MFNVVTYCRVSSEEQAQKDISIPAQRKLLNRWVEERPDHRVVAEFVDEGSPPTRPPTSAPASARWSATAGSTAWTPSSSTSSTGSAATARSPSSSRACSASTASQVKSITENFDPETPQGFLYEGMIEVINQFYSMNLATETLKGMRENAERGHVNGGRIPFGYRIETVADRTGREHGVLAFANEQDVATVREIFDMAANRGMGGKAIANALNARGVQAPRTRHWCGSTVDGILRNRAYLGEAVWFRTRKQGRDGRQRTDPAEHIVVENAHPAMVDVDTFERRKARSAERAFYVRTSPCKKVNYLLSRLIVCDVCGGHFGGRRLLQTDKDGMRTERYAYYCGGYMNKGTSVCSSLPIPRFWLEGVVLRLIRSRLCEESSLAEFEARVRKRIDAIRRDYGSDTRAVEVKLVDLERRIQNYYRAIGDGVDPLVCKAQIAELTAKKEQIEREAVLLRKEDFLRKALERNLGELRRFAGLFDEHFDAVPLEVKREVVLYFIEKIEVVERSRLRILFKVPFDGNGLKHLADELAMPSADTAGGETVKMPEVADSPNCGSGPGRVSVDVPHRGGRGAILRIGAVQRHHRVRGGRLHTEHGGDGPHGPGVEPVRRVRPARDQQLVDPVIVHIADRHVDADGKCASRHDGSISGEHGALVGVQRARRTDDRVGPITVLIDPVGTHLRRPGRPARVGVVAVVGGGRAAARGTRQHRGGRGAVPVAVQVLVPPGLPDGVRIVVVGVPVAVVVGAVAGLGGARVAARVGVRAVAVGGGVPDGLIAVELGQRPPPEPVAVRVAVPHLLVEGVEVDVTVAVVVRVVAHLERAGMDGGRGVVAVQRVADVARRLQTARRPHPRRAAEPVPVRVVPVPARAQQPLRVGRLGLGERSGAAGGERERDQDRPGILGHGDLRGAAGASPLGVGRARTVEDLETT